MDILNMLVHVGNIKKVEPHTHGLCCSSADEIWSATAIDVWRSVASTLKRRLCVTSSLSVDNLLSHMSPN